MPRHKIPQKFAWTVVNKKTISQATHFPFYDVSETSFVDLSSSSSSSSSFRSESERAKRTHVFHRDRCKAMTDWSLWQETISRLVCLLVRPHDILKPKPNAKSHFFQIKFKKLFFRAKVNFRGRNILLGSIRCKHNFRWQHLSWMTDMRFNQLKFFHAYQNT